MIIGFRVDANEIIATGHLMRCLSIADQIKKSGNTCVFFMAEDKCSELLVNRGYEYAVLNSRWDNLISDLDCMKKNIDEYGLDWIIIDSYKCTKEYCEALQHFTKVMVIAAPENECFEVDAVLKYTYLNNEDKIRELYKDKNTDLLLGLKYAPLREEFSRENTAGAGKNILITTGGTDPFHVAYSVTDRVLKDCRFDGYSIITVLGSMCTDAENIKELDAERVSVLQNISNMSEVMHESAVAFSAGGSTLIELCACRVPTVSFSFADNQIPFSKVLSENNVIYYAGDVRKESDNVINNGINQIHMLLSDLTYRRDVISNMSSIIDGDGAKRIAEYVCGI